MNRSSAYAISYSPCLFPDRRLLGLPSVIVVWPHAKGIQIQMLSETRLHIAGHLTQAILRGVIRQNDLGIIGPSSPRPCYTGYAQCRA
jgi:hypothetical protein